MHGVCKYGSFVLSKSEYLLLKRKFVRVPWDSFIRRSYFFWCECTRVSRDWHADESRTSSAVTRMTELVLCYRNENRSVCLSVCLPFHSPQLASPQPMQPVPVFELRNIHLNPSSNLTSWCIQGLPWYVYS